MTCKISAIRFYGKSDQRYPKFSWVPATLKQTACLFLIMIIFMPGQRASFAQVFFSDTFERGNLSGWTHAVPKAEITGGVVHSGALALHIPYDVPEGEPAHRDCNRFVEKDLSGFNIQHFFLRGYFYLASTDKPTAARKMFYIWGYPQSDPRWDLMVSVNGGKNGVPLSISIGSNYYPDYSDLSHPKWDIAKGKIQYDTWYCLEVELKLNTPGKKDGFVRLWLDGNLEYERTNISIRPDLKPLGVVRIGAQIDRHDDTLERHEDRYWDDVIISDSYNGPIVPSGSPPSAPQDLEVAQ